MLIVVIAIVAVFALLMAGGSAGHEYVCHDVSAAFKPGDIVIRKVDGIKFCLLHVHYIRCPYNACCGGAPHEDGWIAKHDCGAEVILFEEEMTREVSNDNGGKQ